ncbi:unnamed protein product, partial [Mesorhabditis spiculigera]
MLLILRLFIIIVSAVGASSIIGSLFVLTAASQTLRAFIIVIGVVLMLVSVVAWKVLSVEIVGRPPVDRVFLRAYQANYFDHRNRPLSGGRFLRRSTSSNGFRCSTAPMLIPRPQFCHDSPPTMLAPPPPPSYDQAQQGQGGQQGDVEAGDRERQYAPPIYSICGAVQRICTTSPPPRYSSPVDVILRPPSDIEVRVIDCRKSTPTAFHFPPAACSNI